MEFRRRVLCFAKIMQRVQFGAEQVRVTLVDFENIEKNVFITNFGIDTANEAFIANFGVDTAESG